MARRTEIIDYLVNRLGTISGLAQAHRSYKYLEDINDFPTVTLGGAGENNDEYGDGQILKTMTQSIRGYVMTDDDSLHDSENLASDIETVVNDFASQASNLSVHESRVVALTTDEGLLSPYGVCDVTIEIDYEE